MLRDNFAQMSLEIFKLYTALRRIVLSPGNVKELQGHYIFTAAIISKLLHLTILEHAFRIYTYIHILYKLTKTHALLYLILRFPNNNSLIRQIKQATIS